MPHLPHKQSYKQAYSKQWALWNVGKAAHPKTGKWKTFAEAKFDSTKVAFIRCHWCLSPCRDTLLACPDCGTPIDKKKAAATKDRLKKGYADIVAENARKAGKDPKQELKKVLYTRSWGGVTVRGGKVLNEQLNRYLSGLDKIKRPVWQPGEKFPFYREDGTLVDPCWWCGKDKCRKLHEYERLEYRRKLHSEAVDMIKKPPSE